MNIMFYIFTFLRYEQSKIQFNSRPKVQINCNDQITMLKYCFVPIFLFGLLVCDWLGPSAVWTFFFGFSAFVILGDVFLGNDRIQFENVDKKLNPILYIVLPLLFIKLFNFALLGLGHTQSMIYMKLNEERIFSDWQRAYSVLDCLGIILTSGLLIGGIGTMVDHEFSRWMK